MVNQEIIRQIQATKAELIAQAVFPGIAEDDTSWEILQMVQLRTMDIEVEEQVMELLEKMDIPDEKGDDMNEDPGNEEAEQIIILDEITHYDTLGDAESNN